MDLTNHLVIIGSFVHWLSVHPGLAYTILFFGMYFETLVGTSLFVPGELFLLSGSILAGTGTLSLLYVALALYAGAILGDTSSYFIGRRLGHGIFKPDRRFLSLKNYETGKRFFAKYGHKAIFLARLIGPFNLVMPFLAGVYEVRYRTFLLYNLPGVLIGVGEFIIAGVYFGSHYEILMSFLQRSVIFVLVAGVFGYFLWNRFARSEDAGEEENITPVS